MSPWDKLLEKPHSRSHLVQLFQTGNADLVRSASSYFWHGLRRGQGVLVIATGSCREMFSRQLDSLGADLAGLLKNQQLVFWDANDTLSQLMTDGQPDWPKFERVIGAAMRQVRLSDGAEGIRAYGEMVGLLWKSHQYTAAVRLEHYWNRLLEQNSFSLYCGYGLDLFRADCSIANLEAVLCAHTHLMPAQPDSALETAVNRAIDDVLGPEANEVRQWMKATSHTPWAVMPTAETMILWIRKHLPKYTMAILNRAQQHYLQPGRSSGHPMRVDAA